jgi:hypothetical protein
LRQYVFYYLNFALFVSKCDFAAPQTILKITKRNKYLDVEIIENKVIYMTGIK